MLVPSESENAVGVVSGQPVILNPPFRSMSVTLLTQVLTVSSDPESL